MKTIGLKARIIIPIAISLILILGSFSIIYYQILQNEISMNFESALRTSQSILNHQIYSDAQLMGIIIKSIDDNKDIKEFMKRKDRAALLEYGRQFLEQSGVSNRITHLSFMGADRVTILRVHQPEIYGDAVDRLTMKRAAETGQTSWGMELGPIGTYTLRTVTPLYQGKRLLGFIELGEDIGFITKSIRDILSLEIIILINKELLDKGAWETGMKLLGRESNWDQLPSAVIYYNSLLNPANFKADMIEPIMKNRRMEMEYSGSVYGCGIIPLRDVKGVQAGNMIVLMDITEAKNGFRNAMLFAGSVSLLVGVALFIFFFVYTARIEDQLKKADIELREREERFRTIATSANDAIIISNSREIISYWNPASVRLFGYTAAEAQGKMIKELVIPLNFTDKYSTLISEIRSGEGPRIAELEAARKDGKILPVEIAVSVTGMEDQSMIIIMARDITERKLKEAELKRLSYLDGLTGIANRRGWDETLDGEWKRAARSFSPVSMLMCDIDYFKQYNDTYGHQAGDECLRKVAAGLKHAIKRSGEMVARYGGEEFVVIMPGADMKNAESFGELLRSNIEAMGIENSGSKISGRVTISVGAATIIPGPGDDSSKLVSCADQALYRAKSLGRNRIIHAQNKETFA